MGRATVTLATDVVGEKVVLSRAGVGTIVVAGERRRMGGVLAGAGADV